MASVLSNIPRDASKGAGGLDYALVCVYADISSNIDSNGNAFFAGNASTNFVKFIPRKETSNVVETGTGNAQTGTINYNQVLTLVFAYNQSLKRNQLKIMGQTELKAVVVDRNGIGWLLGNRNGLDLTSSTLGSGTAPTDLNGLTIVLSGNEPEPMGLVSPSELSRISPV